MESNQLNENLETLLPANKDSFGLAKKALVGKILTDKTQNKNDVCDILYKAWGEL